MYFDLVDLETIVPEVVTSVVAKCELENSTSTMADFSDLGDSKWNSGLKMECGRIWNSQNAVSYNQMNPSPIQLNRKVKNCILKFFI